MGDALESLQRPSCQPLLQGLAARGRAPCAPCEAAETPPRNACPAQAGVPSAPRPLASAGALRTAAILALSSSASSSSSSGCPAAFPLPSARRPAVGANPSDQGVLSQK